MRSDLLLVFGEWVMGVMMYRLILWGEGCREMRPKSRNFNSRKVELSKKNWEIMIGCISFAADNILPIGDSLKKLVNLQM